MNKRFPVKLSNGEEEAFQRFASYHYDRMLSLAWYIARENIAGGMPRIWEGMETGRVALSVFEKLATPLVFLKDEWRNLTAEERQLWYGKEEAAGMRTEAAQVSSKAMEMLRPK